MVKIIFNHKYNDIISLDNLLAAWQEFVVGKRGNKDVQEFQYRLLDNVLALHLDLKNKIYQHGPYQAFNISDPKPRNIHKAIVRDRLVHHAIFRTLYPFFDRTFIADSYSCRNFRGTHRAIKRFKSFGDKVSKNNTRTCWILKCDIKKFFANINHSILLGILEEYIPDQDILCLLREVIGSFHTKDKPGVGLPLGNLTSQLFVNIYMNKFDQWVKHKLKFKYYARYADDFVFLSDDKNKLENLVPKISQFLGQELRLSLHPDKLFIKNLASGLDFLGWINFPDHRVLRTSTKRRTVKALNNSKNLAVLSSYCGLLKHGNQNKLRGQLRDKILRCLEGD